MQGNVWSPRKYFKPNILHEHTEHAKHRKVVEPDFSFQFCSQVIAAFVSQYIATEHIGSQEETLEPRFSHIVTQLHPTYSTNPEPSLKSTLVGYCWIHCCMV